MKYFSSLIFCVMFTIVAPNFTFADDQKLDKQIEALEKQRDELNRQISILKKQQDTTKKADEVDKELREFGEMLFAPETK